MPFQERVAADPISFVLAGLVWVVIAFWIFSMIGWMVQGEVDGGFGILACSVALVLGVLTTAPPAKGLPPYLFSAAVGTVIPYPLVRPYLNRPALDQLDV